VVLIWQVPVMREWMSGIDITCSCHEGVDEWSHICTSLFVLFVLDLLVIVFSVQQILITPL
jgi:hypothetical protein